jgi:multidrug resistance efflux pump
MFDIKKIEAEAKSEMAEERGKAAKTKIKAALKRIADAEAILRNARDEYEVLLRDIGA